MADEDFVGDTACFSELVKPLPVGAQPFVPPAQTAWLEPVRIPWTLRPAGSPVRVAVCASIMKINPGFLSVLAAIRVQSSVPVQFCFYMGFAQGLTLSYLREAIHSVLPDAEVNAHMPVQAYHRELNSVRYVCESLSLRQHEWSGGCGATGATRNLSERAGTPYVY